MALFIGYYGQQKIDVLGLQPMNLKLFLINIFLLPALLVISILMSPSETSTTIPGAIGAVLGIYSGIAAFHDLLFAGKTLTKLEYQREVSFNDYFFNSL